MNDKICLITGATSGIGKETAIALAKLDAIVVFTSWNKQKGEGAKNEIIDISNNKMIDVLDCDLSSFISIRNCCDRFTENYDKLHVLINNAGVWEKRRKITKDGIENTFAINHLAHFLMTDLLLEKIKKSSPARIINVTSGLHRGIINFNDIEGKGKYSPMRAYRQSKLANILFTKELARRLKDTGIMANCLMPGLVSTNLFRNSNRFTRAFIKLIAASPRKGAKTSIFLATSPEVENISGECFRKKKIVQTSEKSNDMDMAKRLWNVSREYVKKWL